MSRFVEVVVQVAVPAGVGEGQLIVRLLKDSVNIWRSTDVEGGCSLLPYVLSASCRCRKGVTGPTVLGDESRTKACDIGRILDQIKEASAAGDAERAIKALLHRCQRKEGRWQQNGGCDYLLIGGGPAIGSLG